MIGESTLTMAEIRWLVHELNSERGRLERSLALAADEPDGGAVGTMTQTEARHDAIVAALARVGAGTYGICERCEQGMPFGRLIVMPEVTHCVSCRP